MACCLIAQILLPPYDPPIPLIDLVDRWLREYHSACVEVFYGRGSPCFNIK